MMITKLLLPAGLGFIMLAIGLTLQISDFTRVFRQPLAILLGLACQLVLLPVLAFILLHVWILDPAMAIGVMILAASPGGITSNLLTHYSNGDTALSISLTAISSLAGMVLVPLVVVFSINYFSNIPAPADLPVWRMVIGVFAVSTLPVLAGMAINHTAPAFAEKFETVIRPLSVVVFMLIVIGAFASQWSGIVDNLPVVGPVMVILNVSIMAVGYWIAILARCGKPAARAISLEGGLQNGALGIFVAISLIGNTTMMIPSITYALMMNASAAVFIFSVWLSRVSRESRLPE